jgi:hypothetical protein
MRSMTTEHQRCNITNRKQKKEQRGDGKEMKVYIGIGPLSYFSFGFRYLFSNDHHDVPFSEASCRFSSSFSFLRASLAFFNSSSSRLRASASCSCCDAMLLLRCLPIQLQLNEKTEYAMNDCYQRICMRNGHKAFEQQQKEID